MMLKIRVVWTDGLEPSIYEQSYLFVSSGEGENPLAESMAIFKASEMAKRFGLKSFNLVSVESETE
jgi:hypothetical protein